MTRCNALPVHPGGRIESMHAVVTPSAAWMSRRRLTCLIQLDHSPFWPIGGHIGHVDTPRCSWVCADTKTDSRDQSGGLSDRPGVPTERPSRRMSIGIDSYAREGCFRSVLKWSSYIISRSNRIAAGAVVVPPVYLYIRVQVEVPRYGTVTRTGRYYATS